MSTRARDRRSEAGTSVIEVIVAMTIFAIAVLAAIQHGVSARQMARTGEIITEAAAAAQYQLETLRGMDFDSVATDADTVHGYPVGWTVTGTDSLKTVVLIVTRPSVLGTPVADSFVTLLYDWDLSN